MANKRKRRKRRKMTNEERNEFIKRKKNTKSNWQASILDAKKDVQYQKEIKELRRLYLRLMRQRPTYVRLGKSRAKRQKELGYTTPCPVCNNELDTKCILPSLPEDVDTEDPIIGQDHIVECHNCGHFGWFTVGAEIMDFNTI